jgi:hypothetical protein
MNAKKEKKDKKGSKSSKKGGEHLDLAKLKDKKAEKKDSKKTPRDGKTPRTDSKSPRDSKVHLDLQIASDPISCATTDRDYAVIFIITR